MIIRQDERTLRLVINLERCVCFAETRLGTVARKLRKTREDLLTKRCEQERCWSVQTGPTVVCHQIKALQEKSTADKGY